MDDSGSGVESHRRAARGRLLARRLLLDTATLEIWRGRIDARVEATLDECGPEARELVLAFCWPIRNEYDARHLAQTLRDRGALTALPVVVARGRPLEFREWHPGIELAGGAMGIPVPAESRRLDPNVLLLPMLGWDMGGCRLGYGGGYFDRTLAALEARSTAAAPRPTVIGLSYECLHMADFAPRDWDQPMDWVITEEARYRRQAGGLTRID